MRDRVEYQGSVRVVLKGAMFQCTCCEQVKPGSEFGLRRMPSGEVRNQAQCNACRSMNGV